MRKKPEYAIRLRTVRDAKHLTLEDLSKLTNSVLSPSRISNYEQGIRRMGPQEALILAKPLGVSAAYLLCVDVEGEMTKQEEELLRNYRALPEKDRNDYSRRIEAMALLYREPVPDEKLGENWRAPSQKDKHAKSG